MKIGFHKDIFKPSLSKSTAQTVLNLKNQLSAIQSKLQAQNFTGMTKDDVLGSLLYTTAISYYAEYDMMDQMQAKTMNVVIAKVPSNAIFSVSLNVNYTLGIAENVNAAGLKMDVQRNVELTEAMDGDNNKVIQYMLASGMNSSALENGLPEQLLSTPSNPVKGISAIKAIQIANDQGIPIYTINQSNISTILPQLQLPSDVISDIQNAVNSGKMVEVSQTEITYNGWSGVGYIVIDPTTGAGSYMLSGGLSGGIIYALWWIGLILLILLASAAALILLYVFGSVLIEIISGIVEFLAAFYSLLITFYNSLQYAAFYLITSYFTWQNVTGSMLAVIAVSFYACYSSNSGRPIGPGTYACMAVWIVGLFISFFKNYPIK